MVESAFIGGGCFWCLEAVYRNVTGVDNVISGYAGGNFENPTYDDVCSGITEHAEVVQVNFDNEKISFEIILDIFWKIHDPTTLNRQGADTGTQYRSIILYSDEKQHDIALDSKDKIEKSQLYKNKIVTEIKPFLKFYKAEANHQNYYNLNRGFNSYCMAVIDPKIKKFFTEFSYLVKK